MWLLSGEEVVEVEEGIGGISDDGKNKIRKNK